MFIADAGYVNAAAVDYVLHSSAVRDALWLSLWTSGLTVVIGLLFSIPMGYALSRYRFPGHALVDSIIDLPIILPPLVLGLSLLVFFQTGRAALIQATGWEFVLEKKGIVLCQFLVSASFGIRAVKLTFDGIDPARRTRGHDARLHAGRGLLPRRPADGLAGHRPRRDPDLDPRLRPVRPGRGLRGHAPPPHRSPCPARSLSNSRSGKLEVALAVALLMLALATVALVIVRTVGLRQR